MKAFSANLEQYWDVVKDQICLKCVDGDGEGGCRLLSDVDCELREHFPLIVGVVNNVYSSKIEDYIRRLRLEVCAQCKSLEDNGGCHRRNDVDCALDRYYPLVIGAIESVTAQIAASSQVPLKDKFLPMKGDYE